MAGLTGRFAITLAGISAAEAFDLVADVEAYPGFLPWCRAARVVATGPGWREVDNHFRAFGMDFRFRSRAESPAAPPDQPHRLDILSEDGPFRRLAIDWRFLDQAGGCRVEARYHLALRSGLLQVMATLAWPEMERRVLARFRRYADARKRDRDNPALPGGGREC